ncbi:MAG: gliding motility-associated C-terminal domain-containing protein, partial [Bacteroidota bacterium]
FTFLGFLPFGPSGDIVLANGTWYLTANEGLVEVDIDDPENSTLLFTAPNQPALTVFPGDCNTLLVGGPLSQLSLVDLETGDLTPFCTVSSQFIGGITTIEEFSPLPTDCSIAVDLDGDDSSGAEQADFNAPSGSCLNADAIPIADMDLSVSSTSDINEMTISISGGILDPGAEFLTLAPQPNIQVTGSGSPFLTLTNLGGASPVDFQVALASVIYQNTTDLPTPGIRSVIVNFGTADFQTSNVATAFIEIVDLGQVSVDLGPDQTICVGNTLVLDAGNPGATYLWSTTESTQTISIASAGTYSVAVSNGAQCPGSDTIEVTLTDGDFITVEATSCDPDQVGTFTEVLTNQFGCDSTVVITVMLSESDTTELNTSSCDPGQVGVFEQSFLNQQGCDSVVITTVVLVDSDTTTISTSSCDPMQIGVFEETLVSQQGCDSLIIETVSLLPSDFITLMDSSCIASELGTFTEVFINRFGCDSTIIRIIEPAGLDNCFEPRSNVFVPTAFSPNDDGVNDRFTLFGEAGEFTIEELRVFTRWGESVFVGMELPPNDLSRGWDGTHRGSPLNPAVFVYWARVRYVNGDTELLKGDLTLLR